MPNIVPDRTELAHTAERILNRIAGVIRNRILEGMDIDQAMSHESVEFWVNHLEKTNAKIKAANIKIAEAQNN